MKDVKKLNILLKKLNLARNKYDSAIGNLICKLSEVIGEDVLYNDFPGDGLAVATEAQNRNDTYIGIEHAIAAIKETGTFSGEKTYL